MQIQHKSKKPLLALLAVAWGVILVAASAAQAETLRVMTFNLWQGGVAGGEPLERSIEAIRLARADIVGLQETLAPAVDGVRTDNGMRMAETMGWHYLYQGGGTGILSRFPIRQSTPRKWGTKIEYAADRELLFFNAHFSARPYQPYQLLKIPYGDTPFISSENETIRWAERARGNEVTSLLKELQPALASGTPAVLTGDFNEPSHLDWTTRCAAAKKCPLKVEFPTTPRIMEAGMVDAWRTIYPDEVVRPGFTWTPTTLPSDPQDRHDRIDFVLVSRGVRVTKAERVGEEGECELFLATWPSDHRAVVTTIELKD